MTTLRLSDDARGIEQAAEILKQGGIVAIPTETVYGLAASAFDNAAIEKIFAAKGRPQDNPLIVHIADLDGIEKIVSDFPKSAKLLAERFWPGPLTMVLPKTDAVASSVSAGLSTVAVRMPSDPVARQIIRAAGLPLAAPSANLSGSPSPTSAAHVLSDLDGRIDAVVLSRDAVVGVESTVVSLTGAHPRLLRPGGITVSQLRELLPDLEIDEAVLSRLKEGQTAASPGMKYKHYAPKTKVVLVEAEKDAFCDFVNRQPDCGAICFEEDLPKLNCQALCYGAFQDQKRQANRVFALLRKVDALGVNTVFVHAPGKDGIGLAVYNRLIRAAGFQVIRL